MPISDNNLSRLQKALVGKNPRQSSARIVHSQVTTREVSSSLAALTGAIVARGNTAGNQPILSGGAGRGGAGGVTTSTLHSTGSDSGSGRAMFWGIPGFGWEPDPSTTPAASTVTYIE